MVTSLDPQTSRRASRRRAGAAYDLFLGIPVHCAPEVVVDSDLAEDGWIPVDPATFATKFPGVFAVGDVTSAPVPRAGGIAEGEAATVADVLIAQLTGGRPGPRTTARRGATSSWATIWSAASTSTSSPTIRPSQSSAAPNAALTEEKREWDQPEPLGGSGREASPTT